MSEWEAALRRVRRKKPAPPSMERRVPSEPYERHRPFDWPHEHIRRAGPRRWDDEPELLTDAEWADLLGCNVRQIYRWMKIGLTYFQADHIATVLGKHPSAIWDNWWEVTEAAVERERASKPRRLVVV